MNGRILFYSIVVALAGFLFGFDTAVISGAEQAIQQLWNLNVFQHGLSVSIALIGTVIGALLGGIPTDKIGRKNTLFWIAVLYLISALGSAIATDWYLFLFFRLVGGLGVGASSVAAPLYIAEIAPAQRRGRLVALFQSNIVLGIVLAYISNYLLADTGMFAWRWMLGVEVFPALLFLVLVIFIPKSPRWLVVRKGDLNQARSVLRSLYPGQVEAMMSEIQRQQAVPLKRERLWHSQYRLPVLLVVLFAVFNQMSGINAIIYYAPRVLEMTGLGPRAALLSTVGLGLVNFAFTLLALYCIDKLGRRTLMLIGSAGLVVSLVLVSRAFYMGDFSGYAVMLYLVMFIAFFAFSQGAVIWVFFAEIFPTSVRASGQALGSFMHWIMAALVAFAFPALTQIFGAGTTFLLFAGAMVLQFLFVWKMMPETAGKSLERIELHEPELPAALASLK